MKRKKQPSAEVYREQLRLAADEIIRLRQWKFWYESMGLHAPWWKRIFRKSA